MWRYSRPARRTTVEAVGKEEEKGVPNANALAKGDNAVLCLCLWVHLADETSSRICWRSPLAPTKKVGHYSESGVDGGVATWLALRIPVPHCWYHWPVTMKVARSVTRHYDYQAQLTLATPPRRRSRSPQCKQVLFLSIRSRVTPSLSSLAEDNRAPAAPAMSWPACNQNETHTSL